MAATPATALARGTPAGLPLRDGFYTVITFGTDDTLSIWEKSTTPPGQDGGDPIDTTTFHNSVFRTKYPRTLIETTDGTIVCAYDPGDLDAILGHINVNQSITVTFNDESTQAFWGYMKSFTPNEHSDGEQPEATVEFVITNTDSAFLEDTGGPAIVSVAGT